jgi:hypothetical protein
VASKGRCGQGRLQVKAVLWPGAARRPSRGEEPGAYCEGGSSYGEQVGQLLLGGLITLAATAVVQIFLTPWAQSRDRRRERWERDVIELETLLQDELPNLIVATRTSAERYRRAIQLPATAPAAAFAATVDQMRTEASEDARDMVEMARTLNLLEKRVRLVHRRAPLWADLHDAIRALTDQLAKGSTAYTLRGADDSALAQRWKSLEDSLQEAAQTLELVASPMKPPPDNKVSAWLFGRRLQRSRSAAAWTQAYRRVYGGVRRSRDA